ncbi:MAG: hypothetical protein ABH836_03955 [Candidatus Omnitrophota bacterium]
MHKEETKINCPVSRKQEFVIKDIIDKINQAENARDKARYAEELRGKADILINCPDFEKENIDCNSCRFIANLRKKTADLIIKAKKLE